MVGQFVLDAYPPRLLVMAHARLLLVGFMLMVMGAAIWMLQRPRARRHSPPARANGDCLLGDGDVDGSARRCRDQRGGSGSARPAVDSSRWGALPARRNHSLRAEHVVARAHASGGRAAGPLRGEPGTSMGDGPRRHFATV